MTSADAGPTEEPNAEPRPGMLPLAGMRVLEVSSFVAAPLGGMTLAQLGADVVRVDPLGGRRTTGAGRWRRPAPACTGRA